jgi:oligopeptidase A
MVKDHAALREAIQVVQPRAVQLSLWMQQSRPLYEALQELRMDAGRWYQLSNVQQRIVEHRLLDMKHAGVGFDPESPEHKRCNEIHQYLTKFSIIFGDNLLDAIKKYGRLVEDKALLAGCSDHLLRILANHAYQRGYGTGDPVTGPWMITLDHQTLDLFMKSCQNRSLREEIYRAHISKAASGAQDNRPLIREILKLRQELAQLFGYASYADMSLSRKMAKDTNSVQQLIDTLYQAAKDAAQKEIRTLTEFAHEKLGLQGDIEPWDLAFVSEQYRKITMDLDEEKLSQYFPFPRVIQGMFALVERLFDITVREVDPQSVGAPSVWHKDVKLYQVSKVGSSQPLAYFYGDFYMQV